MKRLCENMKKVTAAIIRRNNKILLARRLPGDKLAGKWEFPGGKIEEGETPEACLSRELFEEFGISSIVESFLTSSIYKYMHGGIELLAYNVQIRDDNLMLKAHSEIKWVKPEELLFFDLAPADIPIAEAIRIEGKSDF
jgi:8-oxo-dGTP diphosphatase